MEIIPAIDIIGGACVRLTKGDYGQKKVYSKNPLKTALVFQRAGFKTLHLIDLDGAKQGKIKNWPTIKKIAQNTNLLIEFGGGIQGEKDIGKLFDLGVNKVILGSLVFKKPKEFQKILKKFKEKIIVAVDVKGNEIYCRGWQEKAKKKFNSFLGDFIKLGGKTALCTDIERDGAFKGPNFALYEKLVKKFPKLEVIASGGVRSIEDVEKLLKINIGGVVVGKAIYENKISTHEFKKFL